jgi:RecA-family ATPase
MEIKPKNKPSLPALENTNEDAMNDINLMIDAALVKDQNPHTVAVLSAGQILKSTWLDPVWAVPGILPTGLSILAGAPKVGKSWLALQFALAVASGGRVFERPVDKGAVLYLALEDPPRRLKKRMLKQGWKADLPADFMTIGGFIDQVGALQLGGAARLAILIEQGKYRLVVIDTFSRAIFTDQNDVREVTHELVPYQEMAHEMNGAILLIDHHKKSGGFNPDVIADILGSTAKGAMADTILGLYRQRGKPGAVLNVVGREVEETCLSLRMDWEHGLWEVDTSEDGLTPQQREILDALVQLAPCGVSQLAEMIFGNPSKRGLVYLQLAALEAKGLVQKKGQIWKLVNADED